MAVQHASCVDGGMEEVGECIHKIQLQGRPRSDGRECFRCGNAGHLVKKFPYSTYSCRKCGKVGHLAKRCRSEKKQDGAFKQPVAIGKVCACRGTPPGEDVPD